jgi:hypothetical protein
MLRSAAMPCSAQCERDAASELKGKAHGQRFCMRGVSVNEVIESLLACDHAAPHACDLLKLQHGVG